MAIHTTASHAERVDSGIGREITWFAMAVIVMLEIERDASSRD